MSFRFPQCAQYIPCRIFSKDTAIAWHCSEVFHKILSFVFNLKFYVCGYFACIYVCANHMHVQYSQRPELGVRSLETFISCHVDAEKSNPSPLEQLRHLFSPLKFSLLIHNNTIPFGNFFLYHHSCFFTQRHQKLLPSTLVFTLHFLESLRSIQR